MSYIQCKNAEEVEKVLGGKPAFVSEDFRVYGCIQFWDDACSSELDPDKLMALQGLQHHLEMLIDGMNEMPMTGVLEAAKDLDDRFRETIKILGIKI